MLKNDDYEWLFRKSPAMATSIGPDGAYVDVNDALLGQARIYARRDGRAPAHRLRNT